MLLCFEVKNTMYFVSELGHCDLFDYVKNQRYTSTTTAYDFTLQAATALAWLHDEGYVHRDIKMENFILFPRNRLKLIDFEFSVYCGRKQFVETTLRAGTKPFLAPEVFKQYKDDTLQTYKFYYVSDCYAFAKSFILIKHIMEHRFKNKFHEMILEPLLRDQPCYRTNMKYIKNKLKFCIENEL